MATKQVGKLKLHWSKRGVAFKWGEGEIHRLSFERKRAGEDAQGYDQAYSQDYNAPYGQGYDQGPANGDDFYDTGARLPSRYDVLYQSDWVMYALLVLLPPLGIWIMWKRERFTPLVRGVLSAVSAIWFVLLLIWLFSAIFKTGSPDQVSLGNTQQQVSTPLPVPSPSPTSASGLDMVTAPPSATPRTSNTDPITSNIDGDSGESGTTSEGITYVYASTNGTEYHKVSDCAGIRAGENVTSIERTLALQRNMTPCTICYEGVSTTSTTYFINEKNKYFHKAATCGVLKNLEPATQAEIAKLDKKACPTCIGNVYATANGAYYHKNRTCSGMKDAKLMTTKEAKALGKTKCPVCEGKAATTATTGTKYYSTSKGKYYHTDKTCGGMKSASAITKAQADQRKQKPCPVCVGNQTATGGFYATKQGKYYHSKSTCSGMKNATKVSLAVAKKNKKSACPVCVQTATAKSDGTAGSTVYYATSLGKFYHKNSTCSGMTGAKKVTKATAEKNGQKPCTVCLQNIATNVYATAGGKYYHKTAKCSGMKNATKMSLATAKAKGKTACPVCYKSEAGNTIYYFATKTSRYYHNTATCGSMKNATKIKLTTALANGKTACPVCLKAGNKYYFATKQGFYYHVKSNCSGMTGASKLTLAALRKANKTPCPVCMKKLLEPTPTPAPSVACYASSGGRYYHKDRTCSGLRNLIKVPLTYARTKGKLACPVCVTKTVKKGNLTTNTADKQTIAYAAATSAYYHQDKNCVSGLKRTTVAVAKRKDKTACPSCAQNLKVYVYVTRSGTKYHRKSTCSGTVNAYKVSLDSALKLNYVRCTKCNAPKKN